MFTVFLAECVEYEYLFRDKLVPDHLPGTKLSLHDVTKKVGFYEMHFLTQVFIMISALFWLTRVIVVFHRVFQFWDIKCFYNSALKIPDTSLESVTWWEVQEKLVTAQVGVIRLYTVYMPVMHWSGVIDLWLLLNSFVLAKCICLKGTPSQCSGNVLLHALYFTSMIE